MLRKYSLEKCKLIFNNNGYLYFVKVINDFIIKY